MGDKMEDFLVYFRRKNYYFPKNLLPTIHRLKYALFYEEKYNIYKKQEDFLRVF